MADHLLVEDPGLLTTIQDAGRHGYQRFGISPSGAMDRVRLALANALVGNPPGEATLEMTLTGPTLVVEADICRLAVAGDQKVEIDGRPVPPWTAHDVARGGRIKVAPLRTGLRAILAVSGGFALPPALGSLSTHLRSAMGGLEGRALAAGDRLPLHRSRPVGPPLALDPPPTLNGRRRIRVVPGPQADHFTPAALAAFLESEWRISARSDRMGCRLEGPALDHASGANIVSDGIVEGSIQVPGNGLPIVLLADRQTTGGYPKIATVIGADLPVFSDLRPGETVRFVAVDLAAALAARASAQADLAATIARMAPARGFHGSPDAARLLSLNLVGGAVSATDDPDHDPAAEDAPP